MRPEPPELMRDWIDKRFGLRERSGFETTWMRLPPLLTADVFFSLKFINLDQKGQSRSKMSQNTSKWVRIGQSGPVFDDNLVA